MARIKRIILAAAVFQYVHNQLICASPHDAPDNFVRGSNKLQKSITAPQEAAVIRQIFELYARGKSYNYILDHIPLITGKRGRPIGKNSLHGILTNERYIGTYTWNKRRMKLFRKWAGGELNPNVVRIENAIPTIIDLDTWERVCQRMKDNKKSGQNHVKRNYLLTGLIECEVCGASFVGHTSTNKRGHSNRYYCCGNKLNTPPSDGHFDRTGQTA